MSKRQWLTGVHGKSTHKTDTKQTCINNVAERNRMQILPYIRVYRGLAGWSRTDSFILCFTLRLNAHKIS